MRGNQRRAGPGQRAGGSIPACAGEPSGAAYATSPSEVYPRVCGGTAVVIGIADSVVGLSPRVRGNPLRVDDVFVFVGSIPACAGEPKRVGRA